MKKYDLSLFVFRRDLRLMDNSALLEAARLSKTVLPCFIFDPRQIEHNAYRSENALQFLIDSLKELDFELKKRGGSLFIFYGDPASVIESLFSSGVDAVFLNQDYTPFSVSRDKKIADVCGSHGKDFVSLHDYLLCPPGSVVSDAGLPYKVYSFFARQALSLPVRSPAALRAVSWFSGSVGQKSISFCDSLLPERNSSLFASPGRVAALKILRSLSDFASYAVDRDFPFLSGTTGLSAHLKFGTVSVREVFHATVSKFGVDHKLVSELYWRDFYTHVAFFFPHVFGKEFNARYVGFPWVKDKKTFSAWCLGRTGFPIVDAGMRQLNETGWMHNRVRMIVASFLTKDLRVDWRWGEKYFAQKLVDYDPCVNNGSWQWAASTGTDAQPYFRIFNPWLQQKRWDANCVYIKKWVPELQSTSAKAIHSLHKHRPPEHIDYLSPIIDHTVESKITKDLFKRFLAG